MAKIYMKTGRQMAQLAAESGILDEAAAAIKTKAEAAAAQHHHTGEYSQNFKIGTARGKGGVTDRYVYNNHPAALAIEYGHFTQKKGGELGKFIPGKFILLRSIGQLR